MKRQLDITVSSGLLIGGYSSTNIFADKSTARLRNGVPIIPASVIKGAVRVEFERLFASKCTQKDKCECLACRIFGQAGDNPGMITFFDAMLKQGTEIFTEKHEDKKWEWKPTGLGYTERPGVVINRKTRTSENDKLFLFETTHLFDPKQPLRFTSEIYISPELQTDAELWKKFQIALGAVFAIGGSKSRGMGFCEFSLDQSGTGGEGAGTPDGQTISGPIIQIQLELQGRHISVGENRSHKQRFVQTRDYIPGSSVRGALAKAIVRQSGDKSHKYISEKLKKLFADSGAIFSDSLVSKGMTASHIIPLSARTCKKNSGFLSEEEDPHGITDVVIPDLVTKYADLPVAASLRCPSCGEPMTHVANTYYHGTKGSLRDCESINIRKRIVTRSAQNRKLHNSEEGQLFSVESMEKPDNAMLTFLGTIRNPDTDMLAELQNWQGKVIRIGAEASTGYGSVKIRLNNIPDDKMPTKETISEQIRAFNCRIQEEFKQRQKQWGSFCKIENQHIDSLYLTINLLSDTVWIDGTTGLYCGILPEIYPFATDYAAKLIHSYARTELVSGWMFKRDESENPPMIMPKRVQQAISRGSVFLYQIPGMKEPTDALSESLLGMELNGIGERREEGLGHVRICDEFHYQFYNIKEGVY